MNFNPIGKPVMRLNIYTNTLRFLMIILLMGLVFTACVKRIYGDQPQVVTALPEQFSASGPLPAPDQWWQAFGQEQLDQYVLALLANNLDLKSAAARLTQFEALAVSAGAARVPQVSANLGGSRARNFLGRQKVTKNRFWVPTSRCSPCRVRCARKRSLGHNDRASLP